MSRARDLANLADEATVLATDSEVSAAVAAIDLTNVQRIVPVDSNISVPGAPTSVSATVGNTQSVVSFVAPTSNGGSTILSYTVISSPGNIKKSGTSSPITITGLTNGTAYTFTVKAHNIAGSSVASSASNSVTPAPEISIDYLIVAGGGSGGNQNAGGGGAGGYRYLTSQNILKSTNYTVTVGGGAAAPAAGDSTNGNTGSNSVFGSTTASGGGYGGYGAGGSGGSGGGGGANGNGGSGNAGSYTPVEGYAGGNGGTLYSGGGGGGSSAAATNVSGTGRGTDGGAGTANSITGSSVTYAGGGGGGTGYTSGTTGATGGAGGGGAGGIYDNQTNPTSGTANTGGGGGGQPYGTKPTAAGGSGVVILRWLTADGSITVGAGLTADSTGTDGSYSYKRFTAGTGNVSIG